MTNSNDAHNVLLDKIEAQAQENGALQLENEKLQTALNNLKRNKVVVHKRMSKKNPFRVLKGGKA